MLGHRARSLFSLVVLHTFKNLTLPFILVETNSRERRGIKEVGRNQSFLMCKMEVFLGYSLFIAKACRRTERRQVINTGVKKDKFLPSTC